jgi:hypothetical protein
MKRRYFLKLLAGSVIAATAKLSLANTESSLPDRRFSGYRRISGIERYDGHSSRFGSIDNVRFIESPIDDMRNDTHFVHVSRYANYYPIDCEVGNVSFKPPMRRIKRNS